MKKKGKKNWEVPSETGKINGNPIHHFQGVENEARRRN